MSGTVYADIYILVNFLLDYLSLYITSKLTGGKPKVLRLVLASLTGALYAFAALFFDKGVHTLILHILVSVTVCLIASKTSFMKTLKFFVLFYLTSFVLAGGLEAIRNLAGSASYKGKLGIFALSCAALSLYIMWSIFGRYFAARLSDKAMDFDIEISGRKTSLSGFVDSGNKLFEPVSRSCVIIVKASALKGLPKPLFDMLSGRFDKVDYKYAGKVKVIPVKGAGYSGIMYGFRPDSVFFHTKKKVYGRTDFIIAADFTDGDFSGFDAIIPAL